MQDLISVVVPIYKVERYLKTCIDSILAQNYSNLEIILVDDGSPDNCGSICEEYALIDKRIKVIHKENGGLSDARNVGMSKAEGKYITFVDSDDIIDKHFIARLYENLVNAKADISCCDLARIQSIDEVKENQNVKVEEFDGLSAIKETLYQRKIDNSACAKLYKIDLFDEIKYPKGKYFEDLDTTYKLFLKAKKIVATNEKLYYYIQREGSILHKLNDRVINDLIEVIDSLKANLKDYPELDSAVLARTINAHFYIIRNSQNRETIAQSKRFIRLNRGAVLKDKQISTKTTLGILISYVGFGLVNFIYKLKR